MQHKKGLGPISIIETRYHNPVDYPEYNVDGDAMEWLRRGDGNKNFIFSSPRAIGINLQGAIGPKWRGWNIPEFNRIKVEYYETLAKYCALQAFVGARNYTSSSKGDKTVERALGSAITHQDKKTGENITVDSIIDTFFPNFQKKKLMNLKNNDVRFKVLDSYYKAKYAGIFLTLGEMRDRVQKEFQPLKEKVDQGKMNELVLDDVIKWCGHQLALTDYRSNTLISDANNKLQDPKSKLELEKVLLNFDENISYEDEKDRIDDIRRDVNNKFQVMLNKVNAIDPNTFTNKYDEEVEDNGKPLMITALNYMKESLKQLKGEDRKGDFIQLNSRTNTTQSQRQNEHQIDDFVKLAKEANLPQFIDPQTHEFDEYKAQLFFNRLNGETTPFNREPLNKPKPLDPNYIYHDKMAQSKFLKQWNRLEPIRKVYGPAFSKLSIMKRENNIQGIINYLKNEAQFVKEALAEQLFSSPDIAREYFGALPESIRAIGIAKDNKITFPDHTPMTDKDFFNIIKLKSSPEDSVNALIEYLTTKSMEGLVNDKENQQQTDAEDANAFADYLGDEQEIPANFLNGEKEYDRDKAVQFYMLLPRTKKAATDILRGTLLPPDEKDKLRHFLERYFYLSDEGDIDKLAVEVSKNTGHENIFDAIMFPDTNVERTKEDKANDSLEYDIKIFTDGVLKNNLKLFGNDEESNKNPERIADFYKMIPTNYREVNELSNDIKSAKDSSENGTSAMIPEEFMECTEKDLKKLVNLIAQRKPLAIVKYFLRKENGETGEQLTKKEIENIGTKVFANTEDGETYTDDEEIPDTPQSKNQRDAARYGISVQDLEKYIDAITKKITDENGKIIKTENISIDEFIAIAKENGWFYTNNETILINFYYAFHAAKGEPDLEYAQNYGLTPEQFNMFVEATKTQDFSSFQRSVLQNGWKFFDESTAKSFYNNHTNKKEIMSTAEFNALKDKAKTATFKDFVAYARSTRAVMFRASDKAASLAKMANFFYNDPKRFTPELFKSVKDAARTNNFEGFRRKVAELKPNYFYKPNANDPSKDEFKINRMIAFYNAYNTTPISMNSKDPLVGPNDRSNSSIPPAAPAPSVGPSESVERIVNDILENELHLFGKHPGYRKKPMQLSTHDGEKEFGSKIGNGAPFNIKARLLADSIISELFSEKEKELDERKVLAVPNSAPAMPTAPIQQPPIPNQPQGQEQDLEMPDLNGNAGGVEDGNSEMPPLGNDNTDMGDDNNPMNKEKFDAGIDANEDEDPKKYIQKLAGKLTQKLQSYNQEQKEPDEELNKYVASMIISQTADELDPKGKKDIVKKINTAEKKEDNEGGEDKSESQGDVPQGNNEMPPLPDDSQGEEQPLNPNEEKEFAPDMENDRINPFTSPKFN